MHRKRKLLGRKNDMDKEREPEKGTMEDANEV